MVDTTGHEHVSVYALSDPRTGAVRYIGWAFDVHRRYAAHIRDGGEGKRGHQTHKANWIRELRRLGLRPILTIVQDTIPADQYADAEIRWIAHYRAAGADLTNSTEGGDGICFPSPETRAKMSASARAKPPISADTRAKLSKANRGRKLRPRRPEHAAAIARSLTGRKMPEEQRAARRGKLHSEETKAKMAEAHKALPPEHWDYLRGRKLSPEHRAKISAGVTGKTRLPYPPDEELERMLGEASLTAVAHRLGFWPATLHQHVKKMRARREAAPSE